MTAQDLSIVIGAFFAGFGTLIFSVAKSYALIKRVGKSQEKNDLQTFNKLTHLNEELTKKLNIIDHNMQTITARLVWTAGAPEKTKAVMDVALDKMRDMHKKQVEEIDEKIRSQKEWINSELIRIKEIKK